MRLNVTIKMEHKELNQARGARLKPYKDFFSLQTWSG